MTPENNPTIPYGYCHCGCGQKTAIVEKTYRAIGLIRGEPRRFIQYHSTRRHNQCVSLDGRPSRTYRTWDSMKQRCLNPNHTMFRYYGERGISICERWLKFENFLADMGERPSERTLDRIDNSLGYSPDNCRWATGMEQGNNTSYNVRYEWKGVSMTLAQLARLTDMTDSSLKKRLDKMSIEEAMTKPKRICVRAVKC